jgi:hypothetical protein
LNTKEDIKKRKKKRGTNVPPFYYKYLYKYILLVQIRTTLL